MSRFSEFSPPNQPRIVTWRAVSTEDQAERESLEYQTRLNQEHVARCNGVVIANLEVPGMSRNYILWDEVCKEVEAFAALDSLIRRQAFDILMCMDVTRLGRTAALVTTLAALCEKAAIRIYETSAPPATLAGPTTFDSRLLMLFKAGQSEHEVRKFAERAAFGKQAQVRKGKHIAHVPLGLKRVYDELGEAHTVVDEAWRPIIELFFDLYVNHGRSQYKIAQEFNARGILTPRGCAWDVATIRMFLKNRWTYAGYVTWGQHSKHPEKAFRVKAEWDAIISEEMARAAERGKDLHAKAPKAAGRPRRFSLLLMCQQCGQTLHAVQSTGKHRKTELETGYYCRHRCPQSWVREGVVMDAIERAIEYLQELANLEELVGETPPEHEGLAELLNESRKALEAVNRQRQRLTVAFTRETISLAEYEPLMADLKERQRAIAAQITHLEDRLAEIPTSDQRRQRLLDIRSRGLDMLHHPDRTTANVWLRHHFILYIAHNKVAQVHLY